MTRGITILMSACMSLACGGAEAPTAQSVPPPVVAEAADESPAEPRSEPPAEPDAEQPSAEDPADVDVEADLEEALAPEPDEVVRLLGWKP